MTSSSKDTLTIDRIVHADLNKFGTIMNNSLNLLEGKLTPKTFEFTKDDVTNVWPLSLFNLSDCSNPNDQALRGFVRRTYQMKAWECDEVPKECLDWAKLIMNVKTGPSVKTTQTSNEVMNSLVLTGNNVRDANAPLVHKTYILNLIGALKNILGDPLLTPFGFERVVKTTNNIIFSLRDRKEWSLTSSTIKLFPRYQGRLLLRDEMVARVQKAFPFRSWTKANPNFTESLASPTADVKAVTEVSNFVDRMLVKFTFLPNKIVSVISRALGEHFYDESNDEFAAQAESYLELMAQGDKMKENILEIEKQNEDLIQTNRDLQAANANLQDDIALLQAKQASCPECSSVKISLWKRWTGVFKLSKERMFGTLKSFYEQMKFW